jgi:hypothetical protein
VYVLPRPVKVTRSFTKAHRGQSDLSVIDFSSPVAWPLVPGDDQFSKRAHDACLDDTMLYYEWSVQFHDIKVTP